MREGLEGNSLPLHRHYHNIVRSVLAAAEKLSGASSSARDRVSRRSRGVRMIPASFEYEVADSPAHALSLLTEYGEDARRSLLSGSGHSLLPMMKVRLGPVEAAVLIDIARITELSGIKVEGDEIVIGATTRHADVAESELLRAEVPILAYAAAQVGDPQIRHRGTIGGSLAHADPAADLPMALVALGGSVEITGPSVERAWSARTTSSSGRSENHLLRPGRAAHRGSACRAAPQFRWGYQKFTRRANDWAIVGAAAYDDGRGSRLPPWAARRCAPSGARRR